MATNSYIMPNSDFSLLKAIISWLKPICRVENVVVCTNDIIIYICNNGQNLVTTGGGK